MSISFSPSFSSKSSSRFSYYSCNNISSTFVRKTSSTHWILPSRSHPCCDMSGIVKDTVVERFYNDASMLDLRIIVKQNCTKEMQRYQFYFLWYTSCHKFESKLCQYFSFNNHRADRQILLIQFFFILTFFNQFQTFFFSFSKKWWNVIIPCKRAKNYQSINRICSMSISVQYLFLSGVPRTVIYQNSIPKLIK